MLASQIKHWQGGERDATFVVEQVIAGDGLCFRFGGGDAAGRVRAWFRMVEAFSVRQA